ncbi:MAG: DNA adenine methylase [Firmicutes bacterium]|nr:DNA adenine methylase [Bacillota bacterium]
MANYGVPYKGSKNKIAKQIIDFLPSGGTLYDLFAGGCAITHCAMESGKYDRYIVNDIEPGITQLFIDAVNGKYANEKRWISREDFFKLKESDPYVKYCWSFANNGRDYLYSKEIEPLKKHLHNIFFAENSQEARLEWKAFIRDFRTSKQSLERLQSLQSLQSLERLCTDYRNIRIESDAVIYCDIPYKNTNRYGDEKAEFDYNSFYDWACSQNVPVFISEYDMPEDRFECVLEIKKQSCMAATKTLSVTEKLYIPRKKGKIK